MSSTRQAAGPPPGLDRNDTRGHILLAVVWTIVPISLLTLVLRVYTRLVFRKSLGKDDYMACASMVFVFATGCIMTALTRHGEGVHYAFLEDEELRTYNKLFYVDIIFYNIALYSIKLHVLMQYLLLFEVRMKRVTRWVMLAIAVYGTATIFAAIFNCFPVQGFWDKRIAAVCIPQLPNWYTNAAGNIVTDIVVFALPLRVLWQLQLNRATRISLVAVFSLGFFTVCISLIRLNFLNMLGDDPTYNDPTLAAWSIAELCCGMIVSCAPTLRPLLNQYFPNLLGSHGSRGTRPHGHTYAAHSYGVDRDIELAKGGTRSVPGKAPVTSTVSDKLGQPRGSGSTVELTSPSGMGVSSEKRDTRPLSSDSDSESIERSGGLPLQHPPHRPTVTAHVHAPNSPPRNKKEMGRFLGLGGATKTSVSASGLDGVSVAQPSPAAVPGKTMGISVRREISQQSGPSYR